MRTVLIGAGGTGTAFAMASRLRANWVHGVRLLITDIFDAHLVTGALLADKCIKVPYANDPDFKRVIREILLKEEVKTYIPLLNEELIAASEIMTDPACAHIDIWSSPQYALCTDKIYADGFLNTIGVRTPEKRDGGNPQGDGPWFAKPRSGSGSKGGRIVSATDIEALPADALDALLIQELCAGPEVTVDSFYNADNGDCYAYCRERIEAKSGVCTKARIFYDTELLDYAEKIGRGLHQRGTICFQAMKSGQGWAVTDLNVRPGAGTAMTCAAGFDVLSAAYACRTGEEYKPYIARLAQSQEVYVTRQYSEFVMRSHG